MKFLKFMLARSSFNRLDLIVFSILMTFSISTGNVIWSLWMIPWGIISVYLENKYRD